MGQRRGYISATRNGGHVAYEPTGWLFPVFPWTAFAFAGCAAGLLLTWSMRAGRERAMIAGLGAAGAGLWFLSGWLDALPVRLYAVYDYWRTSPNFFLRRVAMLLLSVIRTRMKKKPAPKPAQASGVPSPAV
jgi:hypothetical protein